MFSPPQPGIGIGPTTDPRTAAVNRMGTGQKVFSAFGEVGAALQGRPSPIDSQIRLEREERITKLQEFKAHNDALEDSVKLLKQMRGPERAGFARTRAAQLNSLSSGLGDSLVGLAERPDILESIGDLKSIPAVQVAARVGGQEAVENLVKSPTFWEKVAQPHFDNEKVPLITRKVKALSDQFKLANPERFKEIEENGITASEVMEMNDAFAGRQDKFSGLALTDNETAILSRNEAQVYGALGILGSKDEADVKKYRLKRRGEQTVKGDKDAEYSPATVSVNGKNVSALVDKQGNYIDANTRQKLSGVQPQITAADEQKNRELTGRKEGVENLEKAVDALEKIVKRNPRSSAGLLSPLARGVEYMSGSLNPEGEGTAPGTQAVQLRDSIMAGMGTLGRLSNQDRQRIENALQVGSGGNPKNLPLAIEILRDNIRKERSEVGAPGARPKPGGGKKDYSGMSDDDLLKALSGG